MQKKPGDVVVVRVSEQGDREDENFHSPKAQLARAKSWSKDQGNRVVDAFEEIDVSGKLPLARRPGLLKGIEMVEAGEADHIVVAYFDRRRHALRGPWLLAPARARSARPLRRDRYHRSCEHLWLACSAVRALWASDASAPKNRGTCERDRRLPRLLLRGRGEACAGGIGH